MNTKITTVIVLIIIVALGWFWYRQSHAVTPNQEVPTMGELGGTDQDGMTPETTGTTTATSTVTTVANAKNFTVNGGNFYFSPKTLSVKKGDTITIHFVNAGGFHDLKIDEFNVATPRVQSGATVDVTFVADKIGSFEYYCSVGEHRQMGMVGTLTVK